MNFLPVLLALSLGKILAASQNRIGFAQTRVCLSEAGAKISVARGAGRHPFKRRDRFAEYLHRRRRLSGSDQALRDSVVAESEVRAGQRIVWVSCDQGAEDLMCFAVGFQRSLGVALLDAVGRQTVDPFS